MKKIFTKNMANIFISLQSSLKMIQIIPPEPKNFKRFNLKRSFLLVWLTLFVGFLCVCSIPAKTIIEYSKVILSVAAGIIILCLFLILLWHIPNIFELIDYFENLIEMRKFISFLRSTKKLMTKKCLHEINIHPGQNNSGSRAIYKEASELIEKYCPMIRLCVVNGTVHSAMAINLVVTLFVYFTNGIDEYDYNFLFPLW